MTDVTVTDGSTSSEQPPGTLSARATAAAPRRRQTSSAAQVFLRTALPLVLAIVVLAAYTNSRNSAFLSTNNLQNILVQVSVLGILAVGQTFLLVGGQLDLSVGSLASLVGVLGATAYADGWSTPVVVLALMALGAVIGLLWGLIVTALRVPPFILTIGGLSVFSSVALVVSDNRPIPLAGGLQTLGFGSWLGLRAPVTVLLVVAVAGGVLLHFTRFGRNTFALGSSPQASYLAGVPTRRLTILLFTLNSTLAALGGIVLLARLSAGDPRSGAGLELSAVAAIVLGGAALSGGRGSVIGSLLGVLVFGVVNASLTFLDISGAYQSLVSGGILILAVTATALSDLRAGRSAPSRLGLTAARLLRRAPA